MTEGTFLTNISIYHTLSKIYLVGEHGNSSSKSYQLLKIDKSNGETLDVAEDPTLYSAKELSKLLQCLDAGNQSSGGLRTITTEPVPVRETNTSTVVYLGYLLQG